MSPNKVAIFGSADRELPQLLANMGIRAISLTLKDLVVAAAGSRAFDAVLVDVRGEQQLPEGIHAFKRRHPTTSIVLVTSSLDPALMLEAMRAGVSECLSDPLTQSAVEAAIGRLAAQKTQAVTGELFAFLGAKGGVGTTTMAVNVATAFAGTKQPTLFMDLHVAYGDSAVFFGVEPKFSVVDALENIHRLDQALFKTLVVTTKSGVDLLASTTQGVVWASDVQRIRRLLEFAQQHYRYVVVDCPRSDGAVLDALEAATKLVLVANQEVATLRSGSRMAATLRQRYHTDRVMVVVSRFDRTSEIGPVDVERVIGSSVKHLVPSDYRTSLEALNRGFPLILKNHSKLASSLDTLARELAGLQGGEPTPSKAGNGLFDRFKGRR